MDRGNFIERSVRQIQKVFGPELVEKTSKDYSIPGDPRRIDDDVKNTAARTASMFAQLDEATQSVAMGHIIIPDHEKIPSEQRKLFGLDKLKYSPLESEQDEYVGFTFRLAVSQPQVLQELKPGVLGPDLGRRDNPSKSTLDNFTDKIIDSPLWRRQLDINGQPIETLPLTALNPNTVVWTLNHLDTWQQDLPILNSEEKDNVAILTYLMGLLDLDHPQGAQFRNMILPHISDDAPDFLQRLEVVNTQQEHDTQRLKQLKGLREKVFIAYLGSLGRLENMQVPGLTPLENDLANSQLGPDQNVHITDSRFSNDVRRFVPTQSDWGNEADYPAGEVDPSSNFQAEKVVHSDGDLQEVNTVSNSDIQVNPQFIIQQIKDRHDLSDIAKAQLQMSHDSARQQLMSELSKVFNLYSDTKLTPTQLVAYFNREISQKILTVIGNPKLTVTEMSSKLDGLLPAKFIALLFGSTDQCAPIEKVSLLGYGAIIGNRGADKSVAPVLRNFQSKIEPELQDYHDIPVKPDLPTKPLDPYLRTPDGLLMLTETSRNRLQTLTHKDGLVSTSNPQLAIELDKITQKITAALQINPEDAATYNQGALDDITISVRLAQFASLISAAGIGIDVNNTDVWRFLQFEYSLLANYQLTILGRFLDETSERVKTGKSLLTPNEPTLEYAVDEGHAIDQKTKRSKNTAVLTAAGLSFLYLISRPEPRQQISQVASEIVDNIRKIEIPKPEISINFPKVTISSTKATDESKNQKTPENSTDTNQIETTSTSPERFSTNINNSKEGMAQGLPLFYVYGDEKQHHSLFWTNSLCVAVPNHAGVWCSGRRKGEADKTDVLTVQDMYQLRNIIANTVKDGRMVRINNLDANTPYEIPFGYEIEKVVTVSDEINKLKIGQFGGLQLADQKNLDPASVAVIYKKRQEAAYTIEEIKSESINLPGVTDTIYLSEYESGNLVNIKSIVESAKSANNAGAPTKDILLMIKNQLQIMGYDYGFADFDGQAFTNARDRLDEMLAKKPDGSLKHPQWICNMFSYATYHIAKSAGMDVYMLTGYAQAEVNKHGGYPSDSHMLLIYREDPHSDKYKLFEATLPDTDGSNSTYVSHDREELKPPIDLSVEQNPDTKTPTYTPTPTAVPTETPTPPNTENHNIPPEIIAGLAAAAASLAIGGGIGIEKIRGRRRRALIQQQVAKFKTEYTQMIENTPANLLMTTYHALEVFSQKYDTDEAKAISDGSSQEFARQTALSAIIMARDSNDNNFDNLRDRMSRYTPYWSKDPVAIDRIKRGGPELLQSLDQIVNQGPTDKITQEDISHATKLIAIIRPIIYPPDFESKVQPTTERQENPKPTTPDKKTTKEFDSYQLELNTTVDSIPANIVTAAYITLTSLSQELGNQDETTRYGSKDNYLRILIESVGNNLTSADNSDSAETQKLIRERLINLTSSWLEQPEIFKDISEVREKLLAEIGKYLAEKANAMYSQHPNASTDQTLQLFEPLVRIEKYQSLMRALLYPPLKH